jgi:hypothetical protein
MYPTTTACVVRLSTGTVLAQNVEAPYASWLTVAQPDGTTLSLNETDATGSLISPPTANMGADGFVFSTLFSLIDLSFEASDQRLTAYAGDADGRVTVQAVDAAAATASQPFPRLFVVNEDGSGLELHNAAMLVDYPQRAESTSSGPLAGSETATSVTWLERRDEVNAYKASYESMHVLPPALRRLPEPYAVTRNSRKRPTVVCRQVVNRPPLDGPMRDTLLSNIRSFRHWQASRTDAKRELQVEDTRSDEERLRAELALERLRGEGLPGDCYDVTKEDAAVLRRFEQMTRPPSPRVPPALRPGVTAFDDYFVNTPLAGLMRVLEVQLAQGHVPKYWESKEYFEVLAEAQVAAEDAAAVKLAEEEERLDQAYDSLDEEDPEDPNNNSPAGRSDDGGDNAGGCDGDGDGIGEGLAKSPPESLEQEVHPAVIPNVDRNRGEALRTSSMVTTSTFSPMRPLPPIEKKTNSILAAPERVELQCSEGDTTVHSVTVSLINRGTGSIRLRIGDCPQGIVVEKGTNMVAAGLSTELWFHIDLALVKLNDISMVKVMTTAGTVSVPVVVTVGSLLETQSPQKKRAGAEL